MIKPIDHQGYELQHVTVRYGHVCALDDVSLSIKSGERVGFVGPSGAGKTTLLRLLNGSVRPTSGTVNILGQDVSTMSAQAIRKVRSEIGFIPQGLSLVPNLRVIQNVQSGRLGRQSLLGAIKSMLFPSLAEAGQVHEILECVGIEDKLYQRTSNLSGGQQQRVAIARALYQQPLALLADEPVSSVDPARAHDTVGLLTDLSKTRDLTLCMSLHTLELARKFFPRLIGLRHGRVMFDTPTSDLTDEAFEELYRLSDDEILENGGQITSADRLTDSRTASAYMAE